MFRLIFTNRKSSIIVFFGVIFFLFYIFPNFYTKQELDYIRGISQISGKKTITSVSEYNKKNNEKIENKSDDSVKNRVQFLDTENENNEKNSNKSTAKRNVEKGISETLPNIAPVKEPKLDADKEPENIPREDKNKELNIPKLDADKEIENIPKEDKNKELNIPKLDANKEPENVPPKVDEIRVFREPVKENHKTPPPPKSFINGNVDSNDPNYFNRKYNNKNIEKYNIDNVILPGLNSLNPVIGETQPFSDNLTLEISTREHFVWTWNCIEGLCQRELYKPNEEKYQISVDVCWLNCGPYGGLWPFPKEVKLGKSLASFLPVDIHFISTDVINDDPFDFEDAQILLKDAAEIFTSKILNKIQETKGEDKTQQPLKNRGEVFIQIKCENYPKTLEIEKVDESYQLFIIEDNNDIEEGYQSGVVVDILANTHFGVRHALETLAQLIAYDENSFCFQIVSEVTIRDSPAFKYRGLMVDTARNFISISKLKSIIKSMSHNKLNVLHLHLSDSNAISFFSKSVPKMTEYGAYSKSQYYTEIELKELVKFGVHHGVKIIPEFDGPAHAGNGWQWGAEEGLGDLVFCANKEPWHNYCGQPPCGILNPVNKNVYLILGKIYNDLLEIFDNDIFHMGGDEVFYECWKLSKDVEKWRNETKVQKLEQVWQFFQEQAYLKLVEANKKKNITAILWSSGLIKLNLKNKFLNPEDYIVQIWDFSDYDVRELVNKCKMRVIISVDFYLDHGCGTWLGRNHIWEYKLWQKIYDKKLDYGDPSKVFGGEAPIWSEKVDDANVELKLFPRAAALAERLWSNPTKREPQTLARMNHNRNRLVKMKLISEPLQPESCYQQAGFCDDPNARI